MLLAHYRFRLQVDSFKNEYKRAADAVAEEERALETAQNSVKQALAAQEVLQTVSAAVQQQAHEKIAAVVSRCLEGVFEEPYEFRIVFERKRGKTEARLVFMRNDMEVDPMTASGGGVIDAAAFALRLACMMLSRPKVRRILVLDEPFKFLSAEYDERLCELLTSLSNDLGVQFIIVTHKTALHLGTVIEL
jgi:DNA repair exonuclease SbcCD ATPase subunit